MFSKSLSYFWVDVYSEPSLISLTNPWTFEILRLCLALSRPTVTKVRSHHGQRYFAEERKGLMLDLWQAVIKAFVQWKKLNSLITTCKAQRYKEVTESLLYWKARIAYLYHTKAAMIDNGKNLYQIVIVWEFVNSVKSVNTWISHHHSFCSPRLSNSQSLQWNKWPIHKTQCAATGQWMGMIQVFLMQKFMYGVDFHNTWLLAWWQMCINWWVENIAKSWLAETLSMERSNEMHLLIHISLTHTVL